MLRLEPCSTQMRAAWASSQMWLQPWEGQASVSLDSLSIVCWSNLSTGRGHLQANGRSFPIPWNTKLTEKPFILINIQTIKTVSTDGSGLFENDLCLVSKSFSRKENLASYQLFFLKKKFSFRSKTCPGTLLFCVFIDFLSWHVLSLTALIITYIQMIFKFTLHFQPFQMMSPFALPQIWLPSCLGWATIFSDWIWMRLRFCISVVNKLQKHGSSFTPLISWPDSEGQGCSQWLWIIPYHST